MDRNRLPPAAGARLRQSVSAAPGTPQHEALQDNRLYGELTHDDKVYARRYHRKNRVSPFQAEYNLLAQDRALRLYFSHLSKPNKPLNRKSKVTTFRAWTRFFHRLGLTVTTTSVTECVKQKKDYPRDTTFEEELSLWKSDDNDSPSVQSHIGRILGTFRWNFARLDLTIHIQANAAKTKPIAEPVLLSIYNALEQRDKDALELMAYGAERKTAIGHIPLANVHLVENSKVALLDVPAALAKTGQQHPSAIRKELAERLLDEAQQFGYSCIMPNIDSRWKRISKIAKERFLTRLTSHYLRKRFETRCERIPADIVNPNHWMILMGSKPTLGHMPDIYSLLSDRELVSEYENEIIPRLELTGQETKPRTSQLDQLRRENAELKEQLLKLTKLLTERAM
jgi:hypothetical protein